MKAIIWMAALPPALRKPWCVLVVCCNIRIAAASGRGVLGPAVIHADTGLALLPPGLVATRLPGHCCYVSGCCLHLQSLEEILMFAQFTEQNIISICLNSSSACSFHPQVGIRVLLQLHTFKILWEGITFLQVSVKRK